ncbi:CDP-alcohol phosphatidyltransferase family protein [Caulobacter sp. NIBR1757]|uniref:CDP-alcohol phosphatidyltransferase family protein n=1 Tax=Caulobacter sp. NIBR1757 TaxID=3016000 RepID=UPI0022F08141|nr:CDP-alcohol phosphatidyltransferase family protein [Caulobacter sp. NIBR1757]WGM40872.1 CDP-diacylglycerol--glycerol-3-phosphate 3-phosphatidyltransferase [Caulobacter sp. NIBR1757]
MISNTITLFRIALIAPLFWLLISNAGWPAVAVYLAAGLLDVVDGQVARRLNETSRLGAMLDLVGDRLLTFVMVLGLAVAGALDGWVAAAAAVLAGRCFVVATLNEALGNENKVGGSKLEAAKIACQFAGLALLAAPGFPLGPVQSMDVGAALTILSALLTLITVFGYLRTGLARLRS